MSSDNECNVRFLNTLGTLTPEPRVTSGTYGCGTEFFKPGLHRSRKDCKHMFTNTYFKLSSYGLVCILLVMITSVDLSQEVLGIDMLTALKILFVASSYARSAIVTTI